MILVYSFSQLLSFSKVSFGPLMKNSFIHFADLKFQKVAVAELSAKKLQIIPFCQVEHADALSLVIEDSCKQNVSVWSV